MWSHDVQIHRPNAQFQRITQNPFQEERPNQGERMSKIYFSGVWSVMYLEDNLQNEREYGEAFVAKLVNLPKTYNPQPMA